MTWRVRLEVQPPDDEALSQLIARSDLLVQTFARHRGTVELCEGALVITLDVEADDWDAAVSNAGTVIDGALRSCGVPPMSTVRVEAARSDVERTSPDLVGSAEVLSILGISQQRLSALRRSGDFPEPSVVLRATPVWRREQIAKYGTRPWRRQRGRPIELDRLLSLVDNVEVLYAHPRTDRPGFATVTVSEGPDSKPWSVIGCAPLSEIRRRADELGLVEVGPQLGSEVIRWVKAAPHRTHPPLRASETQSAPATPR